MEGGLTSKPRAATSVQMSVPCLALQNSIEVPQSVIARQMNTNVLQLGEHSDLGKGCSIILTEEGVGSFLLLLLAC